MSRVVRFRRPVLISSAAVMAMLAGMYLQAQARPDSGSPQPVFPKKFYRAPGGQFYVPAGVPVNLDISLSQSSSTTNNPDGSNQSTVTLKEGPTSLQLGGISVPVLADGTPPKTVLEVGDDTHIELSGLRILAASPKLKISATDALSGVAKTLISLDGASFTALPAGGPIVTAEGIHHLRYFSVDQVGNTEPVQEYSFRVDATPPQSKMMFAGPVTDTAAGAGATLSLSAEDAVAGVATIAYRIDGGAEQTYEKVLLLDALAEGQHHIAYYAVDRVGNKEAPREFAFIVDRQPPAVTLSIHGPLFTEQGVRYISPAAQIELTSHDAVAGATPIRYRVDGAAAVTYSGPFTLSSSAGIHRLVLESTDAVQNEVQVNVDDIYVDPAAPETEFQFSRPFFVRDGSVVLNPASKVALKANDAGSGVALLTYSLDGAAEQKYNAPFSVTAVGPHTLAVSAVDHVGNREPQQQQRLMVQASGIGEVVPHVLDYKRFYQHPTLGLLAPPELPFVMRISTSPDPGAETYMLSAGPTPPPAEQPVTFTAPGKTMVKVGFSKKPETFGILIDAAAPKTQLAATGAHHVDSNGITYFGPGLKIAFTSQDDAAGIVSGWWKTLYSMDGADFADYTEPLDAFSREGVYKLRYFAVDNVGNAETTHEFEFTVDTTPPATQMELSGPHLASIVAPATRVALTATDNLSGEASIQYQIDNGTTVTYNSPFAIGPLTTGPHKLTYFAVDAAGNRESAHTRTITMSKPVSAAAYEVRGKAIEHGASVFLAPGSTVLLKAAEGESVVYTLDGSAPKQYSTPIAEPSAGNHLLSFHAENELGMAGATRSISLVVDRSAPNGSLRFEGPQQVHGTTTMISSSTRILLVASDGAVGGATMEYSLGGGRWQPYTGPFTIKASGTFDIAYRAHNPLSTQESSQKQRVIVYSRGPEIEITFSKQADANGNPVRIEPGTLMFIATGEVSAGLEKITYKLDDQPALIYRAPLAGFTPGKTHTVTILAEDLLGNITEKVVHILVGEPK